jgi:antitoxin (DNA-binding transcriptional repressor) of toxin-antitoxin stability system
MKIIDLTSQEPSIEELLTLARAQAGVLLTKRGQPVAQVLPMPEKPRQRVAPLHPGAWDVREDFDEPLAEEFLLGQP